MNNNEIYKVIAESLQNDINEEKITLEYAEVINDIAYDVYIENAELDDEVVSVLDKYLSEAAESCEEDLTDSNFFESINETLDNIDMAFESGEITESEVDVLLEAVDEKIETYLESTPNFGAGGARSKLVKKYFKDILNGQIAIARAQFKFNNKNTQKGTAYQYITLPELVNTGLLTGSELKDQEKAIDAIVDIAAIDGSKLKQVITATANMTKDALNKTKSFQSAKTNEQKLIANIKDEFYKFAKEQTKELSDSAKQQKLEPEEVFSKVTSSSLRKKDFRKFTSGPNAEMSRETEKRMDLINNLKHNNYLKKTGKWTADDEEREKEAKKRRKDERENKERLSYML